MMVLLLRIDTKENQCKLWKISGVKHWKARGLNSSKPLIRETKHLTSYNSPIEDIFDKYVPL